MRAIDTIFIVLVLSSYLKNPKQKYFVTIIPILAFLIRFLNAYIPISIEAFILPIIAIVACIICLELAPISLLLLFSDYNHLWEVLMIPLLWFIITPLMKNLESRLNEETIPSYIRGFPIRIISLGILYYIFYPLLFI
jgi:ABC-type polysaccharide/polyol phosphate export permease